MAVQPFHVTQVIKKPIVDPAGDSLGRVDDLIARLDSGNYPLVTGLQGRIGGRQVFVPIDQVAAFGPERVQLTGETVNLGRFERREGEVLLRHDLLGHKVIFLEAGRLVRAGDIELGFVEGSWRVLALDTAARGPFRWPLFRHPSTQTTILDWSRIEPFVGHVPTAKLRIPLLRLRRLHPAQIADLVEAASHDEGEEIITAVHADPELEADVFEELDTEHQIEFLHNRSDSEAAEVLGTMAADDAADLIGELDQSRRSDILARLPARQQAKVRSLLVYNPGTAGGLMTPDFVAVDQDSTVEYALERVKESHPGTSVVYVVDAEGRLIGVTALASLIGVPHEAQMRSTIEPVAVRLLPDADFTDVAIMMADYNLVSAPVVDERDRLVGVISVDDVLETLIPSQWRRRTEGNIG
jgi:CBS domain-containing protein